MKQLLLWCLGLLLLLLLIISVQHVIAPFLIALIIAYFLNPIIDYLEKWKIPRPLSTIIIIALFFATIIAFSFFMIPLIFSQFTTVINSLPDYFSSFKEKVYPKLSELGYKIDQQYLQSLAHKYSSGILRLVSSSMNNLWLSTISIINIVSLIFITPVIAFYTLRDWPLIISAVDNIIPRQHYKVVIEQIKIINNILSAYIRGQTQVCLLLGLFYATCLYFVDLKYSLLIGFITGILSFIPYIGFATGFIIGNLISFFQFNSLSPKIIVVLIFVIGQVLEGSIVTPKLIGNNVKLHPVWIIFAIFAGGAIAGFVGILCAIPIAAVIGVLIRFFIARYFASSLYATT